MEPVWRLELFGGVRALRGDAAVGRIRVLKAASLLGYLAYYRRAHPREVLIELFWDGEDLPTGRHKLSVALSTLRQVLEPPGVATGSVIEADRTTVRLVPGSVTTDVEEFDLALRPAAGAEERVRNLSRAVALYQGELLAGFYENWIFTEQQRLAHRLLEALRELVSLQIEAGDTAGAVETALRAVAADPLSEAFHQEVMRLQLALGRPAAALRQYREVERILREELDAAPSSAFKPLLSAAQEALASGAGVERAKAESEAPRATASPSSQPAIPAVAPAPAPPKARPGPRNNHLQGAVAIGSPFYVTREADQEVAEAIEAQTSIVLLKGARQVGKTSLLGRALQQSRDAGQHVVFTDFQALSAIDFASPGALLRALAAELVEQLDLEVDPSSSVEPDRSPAFAFRKFMRRQVLETLDGPLVWGLDEVDRLFACDFHNEIFALFRSWHNQRVLDMGGPWQRLTQVIAYATEAHLFITDIHQSPFNVGLRVDLADFSREQVAELNRQYGSPLRTPAEIDQLCDLLGGHPYLVQQGLAFAARNGGWAALEAAAAGEEGPFAEHLRRLLLLLGRSPELCECVRDLLRGRSSMTLENFVRLRSSGILTGASSASGRPRCGLYAECLTRHLL